MSALDFEVQIRTHTHKTRGFECSFKKTAASFGFIGIATRLGGLTPGPTSSSVSPLIYADLAF